MERIGEKLERAWELKINLQTEDCLVLLAELKQELGLPVGHLAEDQIEALAKRPDSGLIIDTLLLNASLMRVLGNVAESDALLTHLDAALSRLGIPANHRLAYEKGMASFVRGDFSIALEEFLRASLLAKEDIHKLWGLVNALFCLENLALPFDKALGQVEELVQKLKATRDMERVECQLHAFRLRDLFRHGKIETVFKAEEKRRVPKIDQARYFSLWLRQLPYHSSFRELVSEEFEEFSLGRSYQHHKSYRLRTLQGILHPDDPSIVKPSEFVDRLYLWVWRWLRDPSGFPASRILASLRAFQPTEKGHRMTAEDRQLLRNSLMWLAFFDPAAERRVAELIAGFQGPCDGDYPLFKLEFLVVHYLTALRDGKSVLAQDYRVILESHPLWNSSELHFRSLVAAAVQGREAPASIAAIAKNLRGLLTDEETGGARLTVDMARYEIKEGGSGKKTVSEPICLAIDLLRNQGTVSCEQFAQVCFNLRLFDALIHNGKIFNLLARMKKLTGNRPRFRMKSGYVLAEGSWEGIVLRKAHVSPAHLRFSPEWKSLLYGTTENAPRPTAVRREESPRELAAKVPWDKELTRRELEQRIGRPRSTTNRILKQWLEAGLISRKGKARSTRYQLKVSASQWKEVSV